MSQAPASRLEAGAVHWRALAACRQFSHELFLSEDEQEIKLAKVICRTCPVSRECFEAGRAGEKAGIWGGYTHEELRVGECVPLWSGGAVYDPLSASLIATHAIEGLKQVARSKGRAPSCNIASAAAVGLTPSLHQIQLVFEGWENCKKVLYLVQLRDLVQTLRANPTDLQIRQASHKGACAHERTLAFHFRTMSRALELVGAQNVRKAPKRGKNRLLKEFRRRCRLEERILSSADLREFGSQWGLSRTTCQHYWRRHADLVQEAFPDGFDAVKPKRRAG